MNEASLAFRFFGFKGPYGLVASFLTAEASIFVLM